MDAPDQIGKWAAPFGMFMAAGAALWACVKLLLNAGSWLENLNIIRKSVMAELAELKAAVKADAERAEARDHEKIAMFRETSAALSEISERVGRIEGHLGLE